MTNSIIRINRLPQPTLLAPYAQVTWIFLQVASESERAVAYSTKYCEGKYLAFLKETAAGYESLTDDPRFYLAQYWEADALIRFNSWLQSQKLASKTKYAIYKGVRAVMDMAYGLRYIDIMVYHAPMFKGVSETDQRCAYKQREQEVINASIARWLSLASRIVAGYRPTGAGIPFRRNRPLPGKAGMVDEAGEACRTKVISKREHAENAELTPVVIEGVSYPTIVDAAAAYGVDYRRAAARLSSGATVEQACGIVPFRVPLSDERALLWAFENDYACNAQEMMVDFNKRKLHAVCGEKRLRMLFMRWGVWPYIDDRLVMPLAVELAMLTGLNVESIKDLTIDCFSESHPLTRQPVLYYFKRRAAGTERPPERELHLQVLDVEREELQLENSIMEKVARLIFLVLKVTNKIRHLAGEYSSRLFIFQDIEATRREGVDVIVPIDPSRKAGKWYGRFLREENLREILGENFSFNMARCRPTLATNMLLSGASIFTIQTILGHADITTTNTYLDERQLRPAFNDRVSEALQAISIRSIEVQRPSKVSAITVQVGERDETAFSETLSGCGCKNPFDPSEDVRKKFQYRTGSVCKFWNMCLFCDKSIITEKSLPKLIRYGGRVRSALAKDAVSIRSKRELFSGVVELIDGILVDDAIFPADVIDNAKLVAASLDDVLIDQLVFQGL